MPRTYIRRIGTRSYRNYTDETLAEAVKQVLDKHLSLREASSRYNIHKNTLWLKTKEARNIQVAIPVPVKTPGGQRVFTDDEEMGFAVHAISMSTYGFPITCFDLRCVAKSYLDRTGRNVPVFHNNFPGRDWEGTNNANQETFVAKELNNTEFSVGSYVVNFEGNLYPGKVIEKKVGGFCYGAIEEKLEMAIKARCHFL